MKTPINAATLAGSILLTACVGHAGVEVPATLQPASNEMLSRIVRARGVQVYECREKAGAAEWTFLAPEAELFDVRGHPIGRHAAGPVWRASDGSAVRGSVKARADAPSAGAIPWLLLATKPVPGPDGLFSKVSSIQRVNTVGGTAPAAGCDRNAIGTPARVAYTADYLFFSPR